MASRGASILQGAREASDFAAGLADASNFKVHAPPEVDVRAIRTELGLSQADFAAAFGLSIRTVQDWEQDGAVPDEAGRAYLRVIRARPEAVREALAAQPR